MESLYHQTNNLIQEVQLDLGKLERSYGNDVPVYENRTQTHIDHIVSNCERLEILVNKEPPMRRANAKLRVDQLKYDCKHLQAALRQIQHKRYVREEEEREREALMTRTFAPNDQETSIAMDAALTHNTSLQNSHREIDNLIGSGYHIMDNLRGQKVSLKGAHKRMLDIANTLGLSNTVMRLIEKRTYQDKYILFGGMIVVTIIMFLVWKYFT